MGKMTNSEIKIITQINNIIYYVDKGTNPQLNVAHNDIDAHDSRNYRTFLKINLNSSVNSNFKRLISSCDSPNKFSKLEMKLQNKIRKDLLKTMIKYNNENISLYEYGIILWNELNSDNHPVYYETSDQQLAWITAPLDSEQTGLPMRVELVLQRFGKIENQPVYIIVQNDYEKQGNFNWIKMKLDGTIINDVNPVFSEAEFEKLKEWIELNKLAILLYWTQEEIGYMEILKYIHPIDKNEDKIK